MAHFQVNLVSKVTEIIYYPWK